MPCPLFDLNGRAALITGGSRGLGKEMAYGFAEAGASVMITGRDEATLREALADIETIASAKVSYAVADMSDRAAVARLAAEATAVLGHVDILVNNAGTNQPQPIDQIRDQDWDDLIELNLTSCMLLTRALAPGMKQRRWGRIIHISSVMALASKEGRNAYSASKAGLIGMTMASAQDLGSFGITVNCIAPGPILTDLPSNMLTDDEKRRFASRTALGRWGQPRELAGPALLLASEAGSYITGSVLVVDGGTLITTF
jgi:NAD(P)-dependent dehydrogenase (short-subunit alcohol dehydrogenase family)